MFNIDNEYTFSQTKNELGDNGSGAMLNDSEKLLAVCLDNSINHIAKNLMLIKKESLIRKIGRDLAATQSSTHLFIKKIQIKKYKHLGETTILESKTSSAKVKSILEKFAHIIQKNYQGLFI